MASNRVVSIDLVFLLLLPSSLIVGVLIDAVAAGGDGDGAVVFVVFTPLSIPKWSA